MALIDATTITGIASLVAPLLDQTADVYAETDNYTATVATGVACRLTHVTARAATGGNERAELLELRRLVYPPGYTMPDGAQVLVAGRRWNTVRGTYATVGNYAGSGGVYKACDVRPA